MIHEGPRRTTKDHEENLCKVMIWSIDEGLRRTPFCPRKAAKGREENLCRVIIWAVLEGRGGTPFLSTKGHEGPRRKPLQGIIWSILEGRGRTPFFVHEGPRRATKGREGPRRAAKGREGPRRKPLQGHNLGCPRRAGENTFFCPRRATKGHEENLCKVMIWSIDEGLRRTPFCPRKAAKGREGPRRKPLQGHNLGCPRRAGENTFFCPRRATKGHEENLCKVMIWSIDEGLRRTPFCPRKAAKGREGPRRKPLQGHNLGCHRRAGGNTFFCPRRSTKGHEENLCKGIIWSVHEGRGRTPFVHGGPRRATENTIAGHNLVYPRRAGENTFFVHEGPRRKPSQGHNLVCRRRAAGTAGDRG